MSPPPGRESVRTRALSLDALRGMAVCLMIEQHVGVWLWKSNHGTSLADIPLLVAFNALGGGAAPTFVTLAGIGSAMLANGIKALPNHVIARRGLVLLLLGTLLNLLTPSWFSWGSWFVLHMMGFAIFTVVIWRRASTSVVLLCAVVVLVATPFVHTMLDTPLSLSNDRMRRLDLPGGPLRLALAEGQFPALPWMAFFLVGFACGRWFTHGHRNRIAALAVLSLAAGAVFASATWWLGNASPMRFSFYPATPTFVMLLLGIVLLAVLAFDVLERNGALSPRHPLVTLGRSSLTLLLVHVVVFRELTRPLGLWRGLSVGETLTVILGTLLVCGWLSRAWQHADYRFGAEWLVRRLSR